MNIVKNIGGGDCTMMTLTWSHHLYHKCALMHKINMAWSVYMI